MTMHSLPFTQGGQTQLHKFRMLRQVSYSTLRISLCIGVLVFCVHYWLHSQNLVDIFMLFAWKFAQFLEAIPYLPYYIRSFCFFIYNGQFQQCSSSWFMNSAYCLEMVYCVKNEVMNGLFWAGIGSATTSICSIFYFLKMGRELKATKQLSGFDLVTLKEYLKRLNRLKFKKGLTFDAITLPFDAEVKHMMITGTTGSGKTNAFNHLLKSIRERGDRAVIVDTTGTFVSHFFDDKTDKLLNPFDKRSQKWCFWSECKNLETDLDELAESLIPKAGSFDAFWIKAARQAFSACALVLVQKGTYSLHRLMQVTLKENLIEAGEFLKDTAVASYFSKESEKTALSIRATLASHIRCLEALHDIEPSDEEAFSIDRWIKEEEKGFLFLHTKPKQRSYLKPLLSAWFSLSVKALMDLKPDPNRRIWFIVDELASLHQLTGLDTALAEARKYGGCFVIGFQNLSQIDDLYNPTVSKVLSDLTVSKFVFETVDPMNARRFSEMLGEQEVLESSENVSFGANEIRDGVSLSHQKKFQPLVRPSDIMKLKPLSCYMKIANVDCVFNHAFKYLTLPVIATDFEEREKEDQTHSKYIEEEEVVIHDTAERIVHIDFKNKGKNMEINTEKDTELML